MRIVFTILARQELADAERFYEMEYSGLGKRFRNEVKKAIQRVSEYSRAWSVESGDIRRCLLHTFPYKLLYSIERDYILVLAVAHQHRKPDYWVASYEQRT